MGDSFDVSEERKEELNSTKFGVLVESVTEATVSNPKKQKNTPQKEKKEVGEINGSNLQNY